MASSKKATAHPNRPHTAACDIEPAGSALLIARIWRGRTLADKAEEYTRYLCEAGVRKIAAIPGNRGIQMVRRVGAELADFQVLSGIRSRPFGALLAKTTKRCITYREIPNTWSDLSRQFGISSFSSIIGRAVD